MDRLGDALSGFNNRHEILTVHCHSLCLRKFVAYGDFWRLPLGYERSRPPRKTKSEKAFLAEGASNPGHERSKSPSTYKWRRNFKRSLVSLLQSLKRKSALSNFSNLKNVTDMDEEK